MIKKSQSPGISSVRLAAGAGLSWALLVWVTILFFSRCCFVCTPARFYDSYNHVRPFQRNSGADCPGDGPRSMDGSIPGIVIGNFSAVGVGRAGILGLELLKNLWPDLSTLLTKKVHYFHCFAIESSVRKKTPRS
jgi:hypothetical protein